MRYPLHRLHRRLDQDAFLYWLLLCLVLMSYMIVIYVVTVYAFPFLGNRFGVVVSLLRHVMALGIFWVSYRPVYGWVSTGVRDLVYGQHESPYPALAQLNQQLESTPSPQTILPTIATTIAEALKLSYVEIEAYKQNATYADTALSMAFGLRPPDGEIEEMPLLYHNIKVGELRVAARRWNVPLSHSDLAVLGELARQVGIALYAAQLTDDLQRAREKLVLGREEERLRIRNDLHDELAPTLSALQLQLAAMRHLIRQDPDQAEALTIELGNDLRGATAEIRQLIYDLRPPMLDELGLVEALRNFKLNDSLMRLEVITSGHLPKLPAALEVALYRIASEALHNVVKHAHATECVICLEMGEQQITLTITDNGTTQPTYYIAGIGLHSMQERVAELNGSLSVQPTKQGGTQVVAQLPISF